MLVDSLGDYEDMPGWSESADVLFGDGLTLNPSELHGALLGMLAAGVDISDDERRDNALALLEKSLAVDLHGEVADFTRRIMAATLSAVADADFAFQPMLPEDDEPFEHRLLSTGRWASGFLTGYTQAVAAIAGTGGSVPPSTAEAIKDFAAIAHIDAEEEESEEAERDLSELVEYMRIAALSVVQDGLEDMLNKQNTGPSAPPTTN